MRALALAAATLFLWAGAASARADWSGDTKADVLAVDPNGRLLLYRGIGGGAFHPGGALAIGSGWGAFTALLAPGDWSGDGRPDLLARTSEGALLMYRGNDRGGFVTGTAETIGSGWQPFTALLTPRDWSGDGKRDLLARDADGLLLMYRGNGRGGFVTGQREQIGTGWNSLSALTLVWDPIPPAPRPAPPPAPPAAAIPDGSARIKVTRGCTRPGGRLKVRVRIRRRAGRTPPRVLFVVFFVRGGSKRVDHRRPFVVRLRMNQAAGKRGRVRARVYFRRSGSKKLRSKTVSKRFRMCAPAPR